MSHAFEVVSWVELCEGRRLIYIVFEHVESRSVWGQVGPEGREVGEEGEGGSGVGFGVLVGREGGEGCGVGRGWGGGVGGRGWGARG